SALGTSDFLSIAATGFGTTTLSGLTISGSATSTSNVGFNLTAGCFAVNGTCLSGTVAGSGAANRVGYWSDASTLTSNSGFTFDGTTLTSPVLVASSASATSTLAGGLTIETSGFVYDYSTNRVGIGTTSPWARLSIEAAAGMNTFAIGSSTATHFVVSSSGNVGIGTASPGTWNLNVNGSSNANLTIAQFQLPATNLGYIDVTNGTSILRTQDLGTYYGFGTAGSHGLRLKTAGVDRLTIDSGGNIGIGTTTPNETLVSTGAVMVTGSLSDAAHLNDGALGFGGALDVTTNLVRLWADSTSGIGLYPGLSEAMRLTSSGNVGIGTTSPFRALSLTSAVSTAQQAIAYDTTRYTDLLTDASGDYTINPSGDDVFLNADNMWVCTGGSCPTGAPAGTGNLVVETGLAVGTSTPSGSLVALQAADNSTFINLTAAGATRFSIGTDSSGNTLAYSSNSKDIRFGTTSVPSQLVIKGDSNKVGIGTTTPAQQFSVAENIYIGNGGVTTLGKATSTFQGDIKINGKLDVSTIDPPYTIDGIKYATFVPAMTGVKEETTQVVMLDSYNAKTGKYEATIAFDELEKGNDFWLFYQATDFGEKWKNLVVQLTPAFDGQVFYKKDIAKNTLVISGSEEGEVSMRLTANRYDHEKWQNLRPDQDGDTTGTHVLSSKEPRAAGAGDMRGQSAAVGMAIGAVDILVEFITSTIAFAIATVQTLFTW
ncbi:MAG: hypothetical protein AAB421_05785, partial [Patescibacteria group bacterium]